MNNNQQIKELRQEGKLQEALDLALINLGNEPENIWNKRAIGWVYYDFLKAHSEKGDFEAFITVIDNILNLELNDEQMLINNLIWPINKMAYQLANSNPIDNNKSDILFQKIYSLNLEKPSQNFSILIKSLHKLFKDNPKYISVIDWVGLENLNEHDFQEEEFNNRKIMALAQQVFISYAKHLEQGISLDAYGGQKEFDREKINWFLPKLDQIINDYPQYVYPPYFKAKLLLRIGGDNIMESYLPFARQKRNDYWVWQLMAEIHKNNSEIVFSSYAKALTLKTSDDFLVKIRQTFADLLIQKNMFSEAKYEIENIVSVKNKGGFKIPFQITQWQNSDWYINTNSTKNNFNLYKENSSLAEELLYQDIPEELAIIDYVNLEKGIISFTINKNKRGFFKYNGNIKALRIGDSIMIRFNGKPKENFYKIYSLKKSNTRHDFLKEISGVVKIIPAGIGFLEDVFIEKSLLEKKGIIDGESINGTALLSFNKKKNDWGWKMLKIHDN